jgi:threonyl-tRNA synthetase
MNDPESSITITLPDGAKKTVSAGTTVADIAKSIGPGLAKSTIAGEVNGKLVDACDPILTDATIRIITPKDAQGVDIIRHSCAHLLGHAVKQLYPTAKMVIGPVIDNGFYYDIAYQRSFTADDLAAIETQMHTLIATHYDVIKHVLPRDQVTAIFEERQEDYKLQLIAQLIADMPNETQMGLYYHEEYIDMCRGPHVPNTRFLEHVKLTKISGAYWRGDANNEQLQRIYGTAWATKKELRTYLNMLKEAEKRDHRRLGKELDLFHFHEEATGAVFWHPKGWTLFQQLIEYMRRRQQQSGYIEVNTPDMMERSLWEQSGHWQNYQDHMYTTETPDKQTLALKPMNCPGSVLLYKHGLKSYRDLPIRMAEFGKVHRYEFSGSLHGLLRVRHFTQDDAHIYCTTEQMQKECTDIIELVLDIYKQFGFEEVSIKLSTRPENRMGDDATWDILETALVESLQHLALDYQLNPGEGAFYGPKLEFVLRDAIGRDWQCGTLQVDMNLPARFSLEYIDNNGARQTPVMLHRALFGSLERFTGILIEHYAGKLPAWLAPLQVSALTISENFNSYASRVTQALTLSGLRAELDDSKEKVSYKIRQQTLKKTPFMIIIGANEVETGQVNLRLLNGEQMNFANLASAIDHLTTICRPPDAINQQQAIAALGF